MEQTRFYPDMSPEQQLQWVTDFEALMSGGGNRIIENARSRNPQWTADDAPTVRRIVAMLAAWPFAADFCEKAQRYGDYMARTSRLPVYIDKVKERLADGLTMTDADGRTVAYVSPSAPMRRRGRPTKEEVAARLRGETVAVAATDSPDNEKRRRIASLLGLQVIVHGDAPREKNNAELAAERAARRAEYDRQNPSLFAAQPSDTVGTVPSVISSMSQEGLSPSVSPAPQSGTSASGPAAGVGSAAAQPQPLSCPTMSEVYADRIETDRKLHMDWLKWLCSDALKRRIEMYHGQRSTFEDASTRAKTMADMGAVPKDIEPWAKVAEDNLKEYKQTEADIDQELAILFRRLSIDQPFTDRFRARFKGVDVEKILYITRPYYEKVKEHEKKAVEEVRAKAKAKGENEEQAVAAYLADHQPIDQRVKNLVERDNPEYAAKLAKEQAEKEELQALHRYIMRKDKDPSDERCRTLEKRIARIRELAGDAVADTYLPVLEKTRADNLAWRAAKGKPASDKPADTVGTVPAVGSDAQERTTEGLSPSMSVAPKERKKPSAKSADKKPSPKKPAKK